jgi:sugar phosphate isomerase/epimerase
MRLGIGSYTYVWSVGVPGFPPPPRPLTAEQLLDRAADLGVRLVQIADNLPLDTFTDAALDRLERHAAELGITLEIGTSGIAAGHLRRYVQIAGRLKATVMRTLIDTPGHQPDVDEAVAALREVKSDFERAGVCLAVENHDRFRATTLAEILERTDSQNVGLCLDTANSIGCVENIATLLKVLGPWIVNLHVKDYCIERLPHGKGFVVEGRPAGQGQLDVPRVIEAVKANGRGANAIAELWPPPAQSVVETIAQEEAWARESVRYLRHFIPD